MSGVRVVHAAERSRYEALAEDGSLAGLADYSLADGVITFTHTEVELEGHGVGGQLARFALDDSRAQGLRVVPRCSFIRGWIDQHEDYADLLA